MSDWLYLLFPNGVVDYWQGVVLGAILTGWGFREIKFHRGPDCTKCQLDVKLLEIQHQVNRIWEFLATENK